MIAVRTVTFVLACISLLGISHASAMRTETRKNEKKHKKKKSIDKAHRKSSKHKRDAVVDDMALTTTTMADTGSNVAASATSVLVSTPLDVSGDQKKKSKHAKAVLFIQASLGPKSASKACKYFGGKLATLERYQDAAELMARFGVKRAHVGKHDFDKKKTHILSLYNSAKHAGAVGTRSYDVEDPAEIEILDAVCEVPAAAFKSTLQIYREMHRYVGSLATSPDLAARPNVELIGRAIKMRRAIVDRPRYLLKTDQRAVELIARLSLCNSDESAQTICALQALRARIATKAANTRAPPGAIGDHLMRLESKALKKAGRLLARENNGLMTDAMAVPFETKAMARLDREVLFVDAFDPSALSPLMYAQYEMQLAALQAAFSSGSMARVVVEQSGEMAGIPEDNFAGST